MRHLKVHLLFSHPSNTAGVILPLLKGAWQHGVCSMHNAYAGAPMYNEAWSIMQGMKEHSVGAETHLSSILYSSGKVKSAVNIERNVKNMSSKNSRPASNTERTQGLVPRRALSSSSTSEVH